VEFDVKHLQRQGFSQEVVSYLLFVVSAKWRRFYLEDIKSMMEGKRN
jgi:hypothetical protein